MPAIDPTVQVALIVAVSSVISPIIVSWNINRNHKYERMKDNMHQDVMAAEQNRKLDQIHGLVNSKMTAIKDELTTARAKIDELQERLAQLKQERRKR